MTVFRTTLCLLVLLFCSAVGCLHAQAAYFPTYKFNVGDVYTYNVTKDITIIDTRASGGNGVAAAPMVRKFHADAVSTWTVLSLQPANYSAQLQNTVTIQNESLDGVDATADAQAVIAARPPYVVNMDIIGDTTSVDSKTSYEDAKAMKESGFLSLELYMDRFSMAPKRVNAGDTWTGNGLAPGVNLVTKGVLVSVTPSATGAIARIITRGSGAQDMTGAAPGQPKTTLKFTQDVLFNMDLGQMQSNTFYGDDIVSIPRAGGGTGSAEERVTKIQMTKVDAK